MNRNYWLYHPGKKGTRWEFESDKGVIAIDSETGDLTGKTEESIKNALKKINRGSWQNVDSDKYILTIKHGDIIIVKHDGRILGVGLADSKYAYSKQKYNLKTDEKGKDFGSYIKVNWVHELSNSEINNKCITEYFASVEPVLKLLNHNIESRKTYDKFLEWFDKESNISKYIKNYETNRNITNYEEATVNKNTNS